MSTLSHAIVLITGASSGIGKACAERFAAADGRVPATFEILTLTAWAPHESQPKPLRPGSAQARLADALGVEERKVPGERR